MDSLLSEFGKVISHNGDLQIGINTYAFLNMAEDVC